MLLSSAGLRCCSRFGSTDYGHRVAFFEFLYKA
jgi:hypothetical protein